MSVLPNRAKRATAETVSLRRRVQELSAKIEEERIAHNIEKQKLEAQLTAAITVIELQQSKVFTLLTTLTRAQEEGTRLVLENRELKYKLNSV